MSYLWLKALHIIFVVCWYAGLFYLPRLFIYHTMSSEPAVREQLKVMERKLYNIIMTPAAVITVVLGLSLIYQQSYHTDVPLWLHVKLWCIAGLLFYHSLCGKYLRQLADDSCTKSHKFFRYFNEIPTVFLFVIVIMAVLKYQ